eukprot:TRINITY_DN61594_c0_g1_i1.p1 TRINITY_DN61594_c0_g1~~TRINITY_DN61594_c0_g1_i1.p1  ORF type:complete len:403 (-),score=36.97 TRINITY_DN61594_c0_g1_i1:163-1371(-)
MPLLVVLVCLCLSAAAESGVWDHAALRAFLKSPGFEGPEYSVGLFSPVNGSWIRTPYQLKFPPTNCLHGSWNLGSGKRGQTSSMFYGNNSFFFLAEQHCPKHTNITLFSQYGSNGFLSGSDVGSIFPGDSLDSFNTNWDWTCNYIVQAPVMQKKDKVYHTLEISEYDGQVRPQAKETVSLCSENDDNCFKKVNGWSVLLPGMRTSYDGGFGETGRGQWKKYEEWNCGDYCAVVTPEQKMVKGKPQFPRYLVGRSFRTAKVLFNISEPVVFSSMVYNTRVPSVSLGLAMCCTEKWCLPECRTNGEMVLVAWEHNDNTQKDTFTILHTLGKAKKAQETAARLGVEFIATDWQAKHPQFVVYWQGEVVTFELVTSKTKPPTASIVNKVAFNPAPFMWAYESGYYL